MLFGIYQTIVVRETAFEMNPIYGKS